MRSLRRPPDADPRQVQAVLTGVVPLPAGKSSAETVRDLAEVDSSAGAIDLQAIEHGLIITAAPMTPMGVPSLLPWSVVASVSTGGSVTLADRTKARVLEVEVTDGSWLGGWTRAGFIAPDLEVDSFLRGLAARGGAASGEGVTPDHLARSAAAMVTGAWVAATRWVGSKRAGSGDPQHGLGKRRVVPVAAGLIALMLLAGSTRTFEASASGASGNDPQRHAQDVGNRIQASRVHPTVNLPPATAAPAPAPPSLAGSPPLQSHEIFGYAPYWTLPQSSQFDVKNLTTLAYFSVDANGDGTLDQSGSGWNGYESQDLADLVTRSHAAGDRVVLTVTCFSQSSLNAITSDPNAGARLSSALIAAVSAKNLDGVNFDFEGEGSGDRNGLTTLITQVSGALHATNPHWQVTMATYASAASDGAGFYNVEALAPALDGFFVMAYDMNNRSTPSATAPLEGPGYTDLETLQQFTAVVPPQKVILGVPYYGYDWPTTDGTRTAQATGGESPLSDGVIAGSGHPTYWDPTTQTPWTAYQVGNQWHETFFDNPTSLELKAQLANFFHIAGVGIWALGMDGNDPANLAALLGSAPAAKDYQSGPSVTVPPGTGFVTTGVWNGSTVPLTPATPPASTGTPQFVGTITGLTTTAPALACLQAQPHLNVWTFSALPGVDVVVATQPTDCTTAMFTFVPPPASPTTTTTTPPTTTTTSPPSSSTTSTTPPTTTTTIPPSTTSTTG